MPQRHQYSELSDDLTPEQRALAEAIRSLASASQLSFAKLAKSSWVSRSLLSDLANGKRKRPPAPEGLRLFYDIASSAAADRGVRVMSWAEFSSCCEAIGRPVSVPGRGVCGECGAVYVTCTASSDADAIGGSSGPADSGVSGRPERLIVLPVPPAQGDRQVPADAFWPHIAVLKGYLDAGNLENATGLLRLAGLQAPPEETADAITACAMTGLEDAADMLLRQASRRKDRDVLKVLQRLNQVDRRAESDALLELAVVGAGM